MSDMWTSLNPIASPAATDRVPLATGSLTGGYSQRGEFMWKSGSVFKGLGTAAQIEDSAMPYLEFLRTSIGHWRVGGYAYAGGTNEFGISVNSGTPSLVIETSGTVRPGTDNTKDCGGPSHRWANIRAGTGTIQTSDAREKTEKRSFTEAELAAAKRIAGGIGIFQFIGRVRDHVGVIAQEVWAIMADEGLIDPIEEGVIDPIEEGVTPDCSYAFLCYDEWPAVDPVDEVRDEEDNIVVPAQPGREAGNRFGVRSDQLALFILAAQEARLAALEAAL